MKLLVLFLVLLLYLVITMNAKIKKGRIEFNDENYESALKYFDEVGEDDEDYMYVLIFNTRRNTVEKENYLPFSGSCGFDLYARKFYSSERKYLQGKKQYGRGN